MPMCMLSPERGYQPFNPYLGEYIYDAIMSKKRLENFISNSNNDGYEDILKVPIYYINLDRAVGRMEQLEKSASTYNYSPKRISGIDGKNIEDRSGGSINGINFKNNFDLSPSQLGCTLSHLKAIKHVYEANHDICIIMEDDAMFEMLPYSNYTLDEIIKMAPSDWNIIQLYSTRKDYGYSSIKAFNIVDHHLSALAYVINRKGMQNILDTCYVKDTFILDKHNVVHSDGIADKLIYDYCGHAYAITQPLFIMNNILQPSQISQGLFVNIGDTVEISIVLKNLGF
jgi:GR25 family glycosyltransferase involved in LPS biosynthesis